MPADTRAHLIRTLYWEAAGDPDEEAQPSDSSAEGGEHHTNGARVQWNLCGASVCFSNFAFLLGTSQKSLRKAIHGKVDARSFARTSGVLGAVSHSVDFFL
jgi:hypothetical protein